jgi:3-hydroxybutyryl-CoA dehydrogenase
MHEIKRVGVLGSGTMGHGIAQVCAGRGSTVTVADQSREFLTGAQAKVEGVASLEAWSRRGR